MPELRSRTVTHGRNMAGARALWRATGMGDGDFGRFSGGSRGLSVGHVSPEAGAGGAITLVTDGDQIEIDIPARRIWLLVDDEELALRRKRQEIEGFAPRSRVRPVSAALLAYAAMATSAATGAARDLSLLDRD